MSASNFLAARRRRARRLTPADPANAPLSVLYLFPEAWVNSPWTVIATLLQHADAHGIRPLVVVDDHTGGPLGVDESAVDVVRMPLTGTLPLRAAWRARRLVLDRHIDVVHVVDSRPSLVAGALVSMLSRTPLVIHFHSIPSLWGRKKRVAFRMFAFGSGAVVGVSEFVRSGIEEHIGFDPKRLTFVHNGVDVERFHPDVDGHAMRTSLGFTTGVVAVIEPARFWTLKKQDDLVRAVAIARRTEPSIEVALVGWNDPDYDGPFASCRAEIEALAAELGISDAVHCHDPNAQGPEIHAAADIVCLPSVDEPFGLVAIEAQAAGRAFVGADSGALRELVDHGVDGLLVTPSSPEALAAALVRLAAHPELREALGAAGRARACREFDSSLLAARFAAVYRAVLSGAPLPRDADIVAPPRAGCPPD